MNDEAARTAGVDGGTVYRYQQEIAQMMFVSTEIDNPDPRVTRLIEDIVRNQVIEMIIQSRRIAQRRQSKYLAPEDLIFLIRYDRAKVNRLRTYLSWKDVRKNAKDSGGDTGGPGGGAGDGDGIDEAGDDSPLRVNKRKMRLPWDLGSVFSDYPRVAGAPADDADEDDEDTIETNEDSLRRLKAADETTRKMTREEYVFYSECRQASFTFRKAKRFREFIHASMYLDVKPSDDTIDILGFLAFEVVHELCTRAMKIKWDWDERARAVRKQHEDTEKSSLEREAACTLFSFPPNIESPLEAWHIREAFLALQRENIFMELGRGTAGPAGGLRRTQVFVI
ncbi:Transcription initiation protein spt3 [Malassezia nana]|uniref:Transcription initiation protein spt3 n=1 Tax=Malassezia nana TaxID=180528 RepID=A0AAF0EIM4_9BASI|nr:Transcription initiation protein spt3 [Malassezia nana]